MGAVTIRYEKPRPIEEVFWGGPRTSSDSGAGWTYWGTWLSCPRRGFLRYKLGLRRESLDTGGALFDDQGRPTLYYRRSLGWLLHAMKEVYYGQAMTPEAVETAMARIRGVQETPGYRLLGDEAARLFSMWLEEYIDHDRHHYKVLGVETPAQVTESAEYEDDAFVAWSCRYDLVVENLDTETSYVIEFKHVGSVGQELLTGYSHDAQLLGQARLFPKTFKGKHFGGILVDITSTAKTRPFVKRIPVFFTAEALRDFSRQMRHWRQQMALWAALEWPKNYAACKSAYPGAFGGMCEFYDICASSTRLTDLKSKAPPTGFVRVDQLVRR